MDLVRKFYDKYNYPVVKTYTHKQEKRHSKLLNFILSFAGEVKGKDVLDAGCGTGEKAIFFSEKGANVTAIDFSQGQLEQAKFNASDEIIKFRQRDILNDDLRDLGKFDVIFCLGVLHHTEDAKKGFERLTSLLKEDGMVVLALYHKYARLRYRLIRCMIRFFVSKEPDKIMNWLINSKLAKPLRNASYQTLYDRYAVPYESYHTLSEVKKWFKENNIKFLRNSYNVGGIEQLKLFEKKSIFFVSGKKKKS